MDDAGCCQEGRIPSVDLGGTATMNLDSESPLVFDGDNIHKSASCDVLGGAAVDTTAALDAETIHAEFEAPEDDAVCVKRILTGVTKLTWERYMDPDANTSFYFNSSGQISQWNRPVGDQVVDRTAEQPVVAAETVGTELEQNPTVDEIGATTLSEQWERYTDSSSINKSFYVSPTRQCSRWDRPTNTAVVGTVAALAEPQATDESSEILSHNQRKLEWLRQTRAQATLIESHGSWDCFLTLDGAETDYHCAEREEYVLNGQGPKESTAAKVQLLQAASSNDRWTLRRKYSLKGDRSGDWQAFVETETHQTFYYNTRSGESSWEKPPLFFNLADTICSSSDVTNCQWVMYTDAATGQPYYVNLLTDATSWDKPENFDSAVTVKTLSRVRGIGEHPDATESMPRLPGVDEYVISIHDEQDAAQWLGSG